MNRKTMLRSAAVSLGGLAVLAAGLLPATAAHAAPAADQAVAAKAAGGVRTVSGTGPGGKYTCKVDGTIWSVSGTCWVTDTKKDSKGVYLQMKGDRPGARDTLWYRATQNVKPGYPYTNTFKGTFIRVPVPVDRWEVRLCMDIRGTQDKCGSSKYIYR